MSFSWRLIEEGRASGGWNMGVDEALLASARTGHATLRLYTWDGSWLSVGCGQGVAGDLVRVCREAGVGLVRRATGGRAVLHGCDLTYAIAAPEGALPRGLRPSYEKVADVLLGALAAVGVAADRTPPGPPAAVGGSDGRFDGFDCFEVPAADEICLAGAKLAGSAQRRVAGAVLQHGSVRLRADPIAAARAVGLRGVGATSLREAGYEISEAVLREALIESFRAEFGVAPLPASLSPGEESIARTRLREHSRDPLAKPQIPV